MFFPIWCLRGILNLAVYSFSVSSICFVFGFTDIFMTHLTFLHGAYTLRNKISKAIFS